jgi:hypothetical protein
MFAFIAKNLSENFPVIEHVNRLAALTQFVDHSLLCVSRLLARLLELDPKPASDFLLSRRYKKPIGPGVESKPVHLSRIPSLSVRIVSAIILDVTLKARRLAAKQQVFSDVALQNLHGPFLRFEYAQRVQ